MDQFTDNTDIIEGPEQGCVLVVSDSHGRYDYLDKIVDRVQPDYMLHLGDSEDDIDSITQRMPCPIIVVKGNCDYGRDFENEVIVTLGRHRAFLTHGHRHNVRFDLEMLSLAARDHGCDHAFFGHTHLPEITEENGVVIYNPGSITLPRQEGREPSYIVLDIDKSGDIHASLNYIKRKSETSTGKKKWRWF